jgi:hypothetical protein
LIENGIVEELRLHATDRCPPRLVVAPTQWNVETRRYSDCRFRNTTTVASIWVATSFFESAQRRFFELARRFVPLAGTGESASIPNAGSCLIEAL